MWRNHAACIGHDPNIFYPPVGTTGKQAKKICARCPVQVECEQESDNYGIWAGLSPKDRGVRWKATHANGLDVVVCQRCDRRLWADPRTKYCGKCAT